MKKSDGRKLDRKTRELIRLNAIGRIKAGESPEVIAKSLGFHRSCIYEWIAKYKKEGRWGLRAKPITGRPWKLNNDQLMKLIDYIVAYSPDQIVSFKRLWTREVVRNLLRKFDNIELSAVSVSRILEKLGIIPQESLKHAFLPDEIVTTSSQAEQLSNIRKEAKKKKAALYYVGMNSLSRSDYYLNRYFAASGTRLIPLYAVRPSGALRFMVYTEAQNADILYDFLERLIDNIASPVYVAIDDDLPVPKKRKPRQLEKSTMGRLKLFYLC